MTKVILVSLLFIVLLVAGCAQQQEQKSAEQPKAEPVVAKEPEPVPQPSAPEPDAQPEVKEETTEEPVTTTPQPSEDVMEFDLVAKKWTWEPKSLILKEHKKIRLNITALDNAQGKGHNFYFPQLRNLADDSPIDIVIRSGETKTIEFMSGAHGGYKATCKVFYCGSETQSMVLPISIKEDK